MVRGYKLLIEKDYFLCDLCASIGEIPDTDVLSLTVFNPVFFNIYVCKDHLEELKNEIEREED